MNDINHPATALLSRVRQSILELMRTHDNLAWAPDDYWWYGLQMQWTLLDYLAKGDPVKENALYWALVDLDVPREWIVQRGAHTYVELDNITFVYRTRHFKSGYEPLEIAPHIKGCKFRQCGHSFIHPKGSVYKLAQRMIDLDRWIPDIKATSRQAYNDGLQERKVRDIKLQTAGVFLRDYFDGNIPESVVEYKIADSRPGAMDIIRLTVHDAGKPFWDSRYFDIPYDDREHLGKDYVQQFLDSKNSRLGCLEMFLDDDTGERVPIIRFTPYMD